MRKTLFAILLLIGLGAGAGSVSAADKVTICHKEPQKANVTIEVPEAAVAAHVAQHGDTVGACVVASPTPTPIVVGTASPEPTPEVSPTPTPAVSSDTVFPATIPTEGSAVSAADTEQALVEPAELPATGGDLWYLLGVIGIVAILYYVFVRA